MIGESTVEERARAVKCPVCEGRGTIRNPDPTTAEEISCHGCGGKGWVVVYDRFVLTYPPKFKGPAFV